MPRGEKGVDLEYEKQIRLDTIAGFTRIDSTMDYQYQPHGLPRVATSTALLWSYKRRGHCASAILPFHFNIKSRSNFSTISVLKYS